MSDSTYFDYMEFKSLQVKSDKVGLSEEECERFHFLEDLLDRTNNPHYKENI